MHSPVEVRGLVHPPSSVTPCTDLCLHLRVQDRAMRFGQVARLKDARTSNHFVAPLYVTEFRLLHYARRLFGPQFVDLFPIFVCTRANVNLSPCPDIVVNRPGPCLDGS
jgi:hypothetical protein